MKDCDVIKLPLFLSAMLNLLVLTVTIARYFDV